MDVRNYRPFGEKWEIAAAISVLWLIFSPLAHANDTPDPLFQKGLQDRAAWEQWFNSLKGDYKTGALYWAGQRSLPDPGSCRQKEINFYRGCTAAKEKLAPVDVMRKTEPQYRLGWNAWTPTTAYEQSAPAPRRLDEPIAAPSSSSADPVQLHPATTAMPALSSVSTDQAPSVAQAPQVPVWFYDTPAYYAWLAAMQQRGEAGNFPMQIPQRSAVAPDPVLWCYDLGRPVATSVCNQALAQKQADREERLHQQEVQNRIAGLDRQRKREQDTADRLKKIAAEGDHPTETPTGFPIEKDAVIAKPGNISWIDALKAVDGFVDIVHLNGLKCSSISAFRPMFLAHGFVLTCDQYSFTYDIQDHGRGWEVTAE